MEISGRREPFTGGNEREKSHQEVKEKGSFGKRRDGSLGPREERGKYRYGFWYFIRLTSFSSKKIAEGLQQYK